MKKEYWKPVVGYEGHYQVSNFGRVKSIKFGKEIILKQKIKGGYYHVKLSDLTKDDVQKLEANRDIKDFGNLTKNEKQILDIIVNNPQITQASIANQVQRGIATLKKNRIVERVGSNKKRHWKIIGKGDR